MCKQSQKEANSVKLYFAPNGFVRSIETTKLMQARTLSALIFALCLFLGNQLAAQQTSVWDKIDVAGKEAKVLSAKTPDHKFPLWIPIGGVVLVGGGIATYLLLKDDETTAVAPIAVNDQLQINCNQSATISVLQNDRGDGIHVTGVAPYPGASVVIQSDQSLLVTAQNSGTFTYTITDNNNQTSSASVLVTVVSAPITANNDLFDAPAGATSISGNFLLNDMGNGLTVLSTSTPAGGTLTLTGAGGFTFEAQIGFCGTTSFSYSIQGNCGQTASAQVQLRFEDNQAPSITCPGNIQINCEQSPDPSIAGTATSTDNCDTSPSIQFNDQINAGSCSGTFTVARTWLATDDAGNTISCVQSIQIADNNGPIITCPANATAICGQPITPAVTGSPTATDNCSAVGNITFTFTDNSSGPSNCATVLRSWQARDACNNSSVCTQTITVTDNVAPLVTCPPAIILPCGSPSDPSVTGTPTATDNCAVNLMFQITNESMSGMGCAATIIRTWSASDGCGNMSTCTQFIQYQNADCPFTVSANIVSATCGYDNGSIVLSVSPPAGYTYSWSDGSEGSQINNQYAGTYTVIVANTATGCQEFHSYTIAELPANYIQSFSSTPATCSAEGNILLNLFSPNGGGSMEATVSGPDNFTASGLPNGQVSLANYGNIMAGDYTIDVIDTDIGPQCVESVNVTVDGPAPILLEVTNVIPPNPPGAPNGQIFLHIVIDIPAPPYLIFVNGNVYGSTNNVNFPVVGLFAGTYEIYIVTMGGNGCQSETVTVVLGNNPPPFGKLSLSILPAPSPVFAAPFFNHAVPEHPAQASIPTLQSAPGFQAVFDWKGSMALLFTASSQNFLEYMPNNNTPAVSATGSGRLNQFALGIRQYHSFGGSYRSYLGLENLWLEAEYWQAGLPSSSNIVPRAQAIHREQKQYGLLNFGLEHPLFSSVSIEYKAGIAWPSEQMSFRFSAVKTFAEVKMKWHGLGTRSK